MIFSEYQTPNFTDFNLDEFPDRDTIPPKSIRMLIKFLFWGWFPLLFVTCNQENLLIQVDEEITYQEDVRPIFATYCFTCHRTGESWGGLALDAENQAVKVATDGRLLNVLNEANGYPLMPPSGPLSDAEIALITEWANSLEQDQESN